MRGCPFKKKAIHSQVAVPVQQTRNSRDKLLRRRHMEHKCCGVLSVQQASAHGHQPPERLVPDTFHQWSLSLSTACWRHEAKIPENSWHLCVWKSKYICCWLTQYREWREFCGMRVYRKETTLGFTLPLCYKNKSQLKQFQTFTAIILEWAYV